ncbi:helix-turn-helix domain-containing protein [Roseixanthobacter glucoisosaccharinicivorans]|uniref:helix-turn-helix domain-containing protein n=1 Tax=Roseixanthobacter glucoisosaccharinicivorans TaxID=3119923 RepID=UPI003726BD00
MSFVAINQSKPAVAHAETGGELAALPLAPLHFTTADLPKAEQFGGWRDFIAATVDLSLVAAPAVGFEADKTVWDLGRFALTSARMPGAGYQRSWRHIGKDPIDHWCLVLYESEIPGRRAPLGFRSLARPFVGAGSDRRVLTLFIPRDLFAGTAAAFDAAPTDIPDTGLGGLLADYLLSLERQMPRLTAADLPAVAEATRTLLAACIAPSADALAQAQAPLLRTTLERARRVIQANLNSPTLTPAGLCRVLGISRSRLYRLFEDLGGVTRYIQRQRLLAALAALGDPAEGRAIGQIAEFFGFSDASGFSRAFRGEFGFSPSDARSAALAGLPRAPAPARRAPPGETRDLATILRGLQA